jgi:hypothetical protein
MVIDKPMLFAATVNIKSDDLSLGIDAEGVCASSPREVDNCVNAVAVQKALFRTGFMIKEITYDLPLGVDSDSSGGEAPRRTDCRIGAVIIEKPDVLAAVAVGVDEVKPCDLSLVVDAEGVGAEGTWSIDTGVGAVVVETLKSNGALRASAAMASAIRGTRSVQS